MVTRRDFRIEAVRQWAPGAMCLQGSQGRERGQTLLVAVLLMMVILLVGIVFVSVVSYNQEQSTRQIDTVDAQGLAEAGIKLADTMLQQSALGADWRPPFKAADLTVDPANPATWATPPAEYVVWNSTTGTYEHATDGDDEYDYGFFGPDGARDTDDDYYSIDERQRGYSPLRLGTRTAPGAFVRYGFSRYPDVSRATMTANPVLDNELLGRGHFLLRVSYSPVQTRVTPGPAAGSPDPNAKYIKIESVGKLDDGPNVWRKLTAYKPLGITDHLVFVTDKTNTGHVANLGVAPWVDMTNAQFLTADLTSTLAAKPIDERGDFLVSSFHGPIKSNVKLNFEGASLLSTATPAPGYSSVQIALTTSQRLSSADRSFGYLRNDTVEASGGISERNDCSTAVSNLNTGVLSRVTPSSMTSSFDTAGGIVLDGTSGTDVNGLARTVRRERAPELFTGSALTGADRYHALTRDSGTMVLAGSNELVNSGRWGYGAGIYIDNSDDVQFASYDPASGGSKHDLNALMEDWTRTLSPRDPRSGDSGWNAMQTVYAPKAVEIEFFPTEAATLGYNAYTYSRDLVPPSMSGGASNPNELWWPNHQQGMPGIKITRHDKRWPIADLNPPAGLQVGELSDRNVIVLDYPQNGVIFAEGNIRIKGELPMRRDPVTGNILRQDGFNVTVASGATIYIDGQILSAQDRWGRMDQWSGATYTPETDGVPDEDTSKVALLAHDCVCLNPTQLVPQLSAGLASVAADDAANPNTGAQHWVLSPGASGQLYTRFTPGENIGAGSRMQLVARHMGADPGPAGVSLTTSAINKPTANDPTTWRYSAMTPFSFGTGSDGNPVYTYTFAPYGALLAVPPSGSVPNGWSSAWLSPRWPTAAEYIPAAWTIKNDTGYSAVSNRAGDTSLLSINYADPRMSAGSSDYWLKTFKLQQTGWVGDRWCPTGTVHAKINAVMYAETGCWFVIPGAYFDPTTTSIDADGNGSIDGVEAYNAAFSRRYNYGIEVRGAITENFTASPDAVRHWTDKWAYPRYAGTGGSNLTVGWGTIQYYYDETIRAARDQAPTTLAGANRIATTTLASNSANLPKLPCLPVGPDLIYFGE